VTKLHKVKFSKPAVGSLLKSDREIWFDDTMKLYNIVGRFDLIAETPFRAQIEIDQVHKFRKKDSGPAVYLPMSNWEQARDIAVNALAMMALLKEREDEWLLSLNGCESTIESEYHSIQKDARSLLNRFLFLLKMKRETDESLTKISEFMKKEVM